VGLGDFGASDLDEQTSLDQILDVRIRLIVQKVAKTSYSVAPTFHRDWIHLKH
jgi:hypothetical protein